MTANRMKRAAPAPALGERGIFGPSAVEIVTPLRAIGIRSEPLSPGSGLCRVQGNFVARATHYNAIVKATASTLLKVVAPLAAGSEEDRQRFQSMSAYFYQKGSDGATFPFAIAGNTTVSMTTPPAADHGLATTPFSLTAPCTANWLSITGSKPGFTGKVQVVSANGFSVISDIDDTIRVTEVNDQSKALKNTLVKPFHPVSGMPDFFARLGQTLSGGDANPVSFHYVTGSVHQLAAPLTTFIAQLYPEGSLHPRPFGLVDLDFWAGTPAHKREQISALFAAAPRRQYVMIGDSTEKDPEVYGDAWRSLAPVTKTTIKCIFIRRVAGVDADKEKDLNKPERFTAAFQGIPADKWFVFDDPAQLMTIDVAGGKCRP
ncbi:hypothetical protein GGF32_003752 [Allomyces javanicus]|nr:hypothetical protein GGF32_003752 [Allomyces javanicus]